MKPDTRLLVATVALLTLGPAVSPAIAQTAAPQVTVDGELDPSTAKPGETVALSLTLALEGALNGPGLEVSIPEGWTTSVTSDDDAVVRADGSARQFVWLAQNEAGETLQRSVQLSVQIPADASRGSHEIQVTGSAIDAETSQRRTTTKTFSVTIESTQQTPIAQFSTEPSSPRVRSPVTLDATDSHDPDGEIQSYEWSADGQPIGTGPILENAFDDPGDHAIELTVTDDTGRTDTLEQTLRVQARDPGLELEFTRTPDGPVEPGQAATIEATVHASNLNGPALDLDVPDDVALEPRSNGDGTFRASDSQWIWLRSGTHTVRFDLRPSQTLAGDQVSIDATASAIDPTSGERVTTASTLPLTIVAPEQPLSVELVGPETAETDETLTLTTESSASLANFTWSIDGDPVSKAGPSIQHAFEDPGSHTISVTASDGSGREATATHTVEVRQPDQPLEVSVEPTRIQLEPSGSVSVQASVVPHGANGPGLDVDLPESLALIPIDDGGATFNAEEHQWVWLQTGPKQARFSLEAADDAQPGTVEVPVEGSAIRDGERLTDQATLSVTIEPNQTRDRNQAPSTTFGITPAQPTVGEPVSFDASDSSDPDGTIDVYEWTVDGEQVGAGPTLEHTFAEPGSHTIGLKVTDDEGASATANRSIQVASANQDPIAGIQPLASTPTVGEPIELSSTSSDPDGTIVKNDWDLDGDGTPDHSGETIQATFEKPGVHTVGLTVTDDNQTTEHTSLDIPVAALPSGDLSLTARSDGQDIVRPGDTVRLTANLDTGSAVNPRLTVEAPTGFDVDPASTDGGAFHFGDDEFTWATTGTKRPVAALSVPEDAPTRTVDVKLSATAVSPRTGESLGDTAQVAIPVVSGEGSGGGLAVLAEPSSAEPGEPVTFSLPTSFDSQAAETVRWQFGDGTQKEGSTVEQTFPAPGTFEVTVTATGSTGTTEQASTTIEIRDRTLPTMDVDANATTIRAGDDLTLDATASDDRSLDRLTLTLRGEDRVRNQRSINVQGASNATAGLTARDLSYGEYTIEATATDDAGNVARTTRTVFVQQVHRVDTTIENGTEATLVEQANVASVRAQASQSENASVDLEATVSEGDKALETETRSTEPSAPAGTPEASNVEVVRSLRIDEGANHEEENLERINVTLHYTERDLERLVDGEIAVHYWTGDSWANTREHVGESIPNGGPFVYEAGLVRATQTAYAVVDHTSTYGLGGPSDAIAPQIGQLSPQEDTADRRPTITAYVTDAGSGLDVDATQLTLDGRPVTPTFHGDRLTFTPKSPVDLGEHKATVLATDEAGNAARDSWSFTVVEATGGGTTGTPFEPDGGDEAGTDDETTEPEDPTQQPPDAGVEDPDPGSEVEPEASWTPLDPGEASVLGQTAEHQSEDAQRYRVPLQGQMATVDRVELETTVEATVPLHVDAASRPIDDRLRTLPAGFAIPGMWWTAQPATNTQLDVQKAGIQLTVDRAQLRGADPGKGLVLQAQNGAWEPTETTVHEASTDQVTYHVTADNLGPFAFALDHGAPRVDLVAPQPGQTVASVDEITVNWRDNRGLDRSNARLLIDGEPRSFTPFESQAQISVQDLEPGEHTVSLEVEDVSGNLETQSWSFEVRPQDQDVADQLREAPAPGLGVLGLLAAMAALALRRRP